MDGCIDLHVLLQNELNFIITCLNIAMAYYSDLSRR